MCEITESFTFTHLFRSKASTYAVTSKWSIAQYTTSCLNCYFSSITLTILLLCWMWAYLYSNTSNYMIYLVVDCHNNFIMQRHHVTYTCDSFLLFHYAFLLFWFLTWITFHFNCLEKSIHSLENPWRKKIVWAWNDMRVSKYNSIFMSGWTNPSKQMPHLFL